MYELSEYRSATLGGYLQISSNDGNTSYVGMTAGHAFQSLQSQDLGTGGDSPDTSDESDNDFTFVGLCPGDYSVDGMNTSSGGGAPCTYINAVIIKANLVLPWSNCHHTKDLTAVHRRVHRSK